MRINITDIYRIETMNSTYEIKVIETEGVVASVCKKMGKDQKFRHVTVRGTEYLDKLHIGASFDVPGVVLTSVVQDYSHFVLSQDPKRTTVPGFFQNLTEAIVEQVRPRAIRVGQDDAESYS
jgi:hypothetical protein